MSSRGGSRWGVAGVGMPPYRIHLPVLLAVEVRKRKATLILIMQLGVVELRLSETN